MKIKTRVEYNTFAKTEKAIEEIIDILKFEIDVVFSEETEQELKNISKELLASREKYDKKLLKENFKR